MNRTLELELVTQKLVEDVRKSKQIDEQREKLRQTLAKRQIKESGAHQGTFCSYNEALNAYGSSWGIFFRILPVI